MAIKRQATVRGPMVRNRSTVVLPLLSLPLSFPLLLSSSGHQSRGHRAKRRSASRLIKRCFFRNHFSCFSFFLLPASLPETRERNPGEREAERREKECVCACACLCLAADDVLSMVLLFFLLFHSLFTASPPSLPPLLPFFIAFFPFLRSKGCCEQGVHV